MNLEELRSEIRAMKPRQKFYRVLKEELQRRGNWKDKPRGNPTKGIMPIRRG